MEKDAKGRWLVPTAGSWNVGASTDALALCVFLHALSQVTYAPPLSEASYMQLKEKLSC